MSDLERNIRNWNEVITDLEDNWDYYTSKVEENNKYFNLKDNVDKGSFKNRIHKYIKYNFYKYNFSFKLPFILILTIIPLVILSSLVDSSFLQVLLVINYLSIPLSIFYSIEVYNYIANIKLTSDFEKYLIVFLSFTLFGTLLYFIYYRKIDFKAKKEFYKIVGEI